MLAAVHIQLLLRLQALPFGQRKTDGQHHSCLLTAVFLRRLLLLFHLACFALPCLSTHPLYSLKFFLSLYGHKLPATTLDISSDSTLLISGSADKNIKVGRRV